jgi:multidrug efflux pump subunit AcrB
LIKHVNGSPVRVSDVAEVRIGAGGKTGYGSQNASPAIIVSVSKQPNANTLNLTENIEANLANLRQTLPEGVIIDTGIFRQADFIETAISNVQKVLWKAVFW